MNKLIVAFVVFFFINVIVGSIMDGGGDIVSTRLTANLTSTGTTINVKSTTGFLYADYVVVGSEKIRYISKTATTLTVPATGGRGYDGTRADSHALGVAVYSPEANVINAALGFNVASTSSTIGGIDVIFAVKDFFFVTIPKLITWDFPQYRLHAWLTYVRVLLSIISIGFVIYMAFYFISALGNLIANVFNRP